jgi:predicted AAA+ superfamily ATPase
MLIENTIFYPRKIYPEIKKHLGSRQITVLTGMRRTGKTTLVKHLFSEIASKNKIYFDLERIDNRELFSQKNYGDIALELERRNLDLKKKTFIALDEIQLLPQVTSVIKYLYDHYNFKFIVTGSNSYYLKNLFTESLSGRKKIFEIYPLDFGEFLTFKKIDWKPGNFLDEKFNALEYERLKAYYEEFVEYGGFPEVALEKTPFRKRDILNDIISSYINIDIKTLADFRREKDIYALVKMLANRVGTRLDYVKLSQLAGLSRITVQNYLELFEKTYLVTRLAVHTKNPNREIVKAKKIYFCDNGLLKVLADTSGGSKFENALLSQLRLHGEIRYWALKTGREIDFVLDKKTALEAKEVPTLADEKNLGRLAKSAKLKKFRLIGRFPSPKFSNYIWGGAIK